MDETVEIALATFIRVLEEQHEYWFIAHCSENHNAERAAMRAALEAVK